MSGSRLLALLVLVALTVPAAAQTEPKTLWVHPALDRVTGLASLPNGTLVATQSGNLVLLSDNGSAVSSLPLGAIQRLAAAPDGSSLVTVTGLEVTFRDSRFEPLWTYRAPAVVNGVAVAARGARSVLGTPEGTLVIFDRDGTPAGGRRLDGPVQALGLSDDGEVLAVSIPGHLLLFDRRGDEMLRIPDASNVLAVAGGGSRVALGDTRGNLRVVDREGTEKLGRPLNPPLKVAALALSADGSLLLAAWGDDVVALLPDGTTLWRQTFIQTVEALSLSRDGARAAVVVKGGLVHGLATGFAKEPEPPVQPSPPNETRGTPAPPAVPAPASATPAKAVNLTAPAPAVPLHSLPLLGAGAAGAALAASVLLHKRGLILLPGLPRVERGLKALPRRLAALTPRPAPRRPKAAPRPSPPASKRAFVPRTPPVPPEVARLLRERAREQKTLENLDYMKGRGLLAEERYAALREEATGRLRELKQKLEDAGFRG